MDAKAREWEAAGCGADAMKQGMQARGQGGALEVQLPNESAVPSATRDREKTEGRPRGDRGDDWIRK